MIFRINGGRFLHITRQGLNAELPLIRSDSETHPITKHLPNHPQTCACCGMWGIYTPSTGESGALLFGSEEVCKLALKEYGHGV